MAVRWPSSLSVTLFPSSLLRNLGCVAQPEQEDRLQGYSNTPCYYDDSPEPTVVMDFEPWEAAFSGNSDRIKSLSFPHDLALRQRRLVSCSTVQFHTEEAALASICFRLRSGGSEILLGSFAYGLSVSTILARLYEGLVAANTPISTTHPSVTCASLHSYPAAHNLVGSRFADKRLRIPRRFLLYRSVFLSPPPLLLPSSIPA